MIEFRDGRAFIASLAGEGLPTVLDVNVKTREVLNVSGVPVGFVSGLYVSEDEVLYRRYRKTFELLTATIDGPLPVYREVEGPQS